MRIVQAISIGIVLGVSFSARAVDYTDYQSICEAIADGRTHAWRIGEREKFNTSCPCELKEYEKVLEPVKYRAVVDWKIDARAFAKNVPEGIKMGEFMSEVLPLGFKIEKACK